MKDLSQSEKNTVLSQIMHLLGFEEHSEKPTLISPERRFTNIVIMRNTIRSCEGYVYWIDKYFSNEGLELLAESIDRDKVKDIKILTSVPTTNSRLRNCFMRFKAEMEQKNVNSEFRVMVDKSLSSQIHDRWILSKNNNYNIPSPDVVSRGQYSEVKKTEKFFQTISF